MKNRRNARKRYEPGAVLRIECPVCATPATKRGTGKIRKICHSCGTGYSLVEAASRHQTIECLGQCRMSIDMLRQRL